ncbi:MAG: aldo/keto reductase [Deltaproteobacteria bacterium]|nr:aldo/keto reductase [Deltaproteobacteria bacterium]MBW2445425.1 aldo/keto reductase [Deltaproteobacteria bacterium]
MSGKAFVTIWLVAAAVLGFFVSGTLLYDSAIGLAPSAFPMGETLQKLVPGANNAVGGLILGIGLILVITIAALFVMPRRIQATSTGRRRFLTGSAALGTAAVAGGAAVARAFLGVGTGGPGWKPIAENIGAAGVATDHENSPDDWAGSRVRAYRRFGRTEYRISDIVLGSGGLSGEKGTNVARLAFDRGVNYVDTSPDYSANGSEDCIGAALEGRRDEIFVATKFCSAKGHLPPGTPVATYMATVEESLGRLRTDHVDLVHIHSCDEVERLMDENVHEAFDRLKQQGKVRFLGVSTHTPKLVEVANQAIGSGRFDVMMLAYHHGIWPQLGDIIDRAHSEQDMGIVAMKTLKGAKHHGLAGFKDEANAYSQAALKWALSNDSVSCAVISFNELAHCDEYLAGSGQSISMRDRATLEKYDREIVGSYCAPHCGACLGACPEELAVHDVLRHRMYFEDYGREKEAMQLYGALERNASVCAGCSGPCLGACPIGVNIPDRMRDAHDLLTLDS